MLKKWGFDPVAAEDGSTAWDLLPKPDAPALILLDWNMPGMDGLEICRRLMENKSPNPPYVILLTARGKKSDIVAGHQAGDEALVAFTRRIQGGLREYDCVGRYGGEEFLVIAPGSMGKGDKSLYERLRAKVAEAEIATNAGAISLTVSIGVAPGTGQSTVDAMLSAADAALYQAKAGGRNRVVDATP